MRNSTPPTQTHTRHPPLPKTDGECLAVPAVWAWRWVWGVYNCLTGCMVCIHIVINRIWSGSSDHLDVLDLMTPGLNCYPFIMCNIWPLCLEETLGAALDPSQADCLCVCECVWACDIVSVLLERMHELKSFPDFIFIVYVLICK